MLIPSKITSRVLTIGPDYKNHRGGIGAVIETYNTFFEDFKFIPSFKPFKSNIKKMLFFIKQLSPIIFYLLKDKDIKIVHIHGSHGASLFRKYVVFFVGKYLFNKKIIYHVHSSSYDVVYKAAGPIQKHLIKTLVNGADIIICLSTFWRDFFEANFDPKQIKIINNVVTQPIPHEAKMLNSQNNCNILFLGRIGDRKGIFDLLKILADNVDDYKNKINLNIGGDGEVERLEAFIKTNKLDSFVTYVGWVTEDKKNALLLNSDIYILPSYNEGLPISILEAMSYGLPIISTTTGGIPELVENGSNGYIFEPGDMLAMKKAIDNLLNNPGQVIEMGKSSTIKIEPYLPQTVALQLTACYQSLLYL